MGRRVGQKIADRLSRMSETVERTQDVSLAYTCRTVKLNLEPQEYTPDLVRATRNVLSASQAIFAEFLGVSVKTVRDWEQGIEHPNRLACRFMDEIRRNPEYWRQRLDDTVLAVG